jgi:hypothetical protein
VAQDPSEASVRGAGSEARAFLAAVVLAAVFLVAVFLAAVDLAAVVLAGVFLAAVVSAAGDSDAADPEGADPEDTGSDAVEAATFAGAVLAAAAPDGDVAVFDVAAFAAVFFVAVFFVADFFVAVFFVADFFVADFVAGAFLAGADFVVVVFGAAGVEAVGGAELAATLAGGVDSWADFWADFWAASWAGSFLPARDGSASLGSLFTPETTFLRSAPALNLGTKVFFVSICSPVCGLRARRAGRSRFSKEPNPVMATFSPRATSRMMVSSTESSAWAAAFRLPSNRAASASMSWDLFTIGLSVQPRDTLESRACCPTWWSAR